MVAILKLCFPLAPITLRLRTPCPKAKTKKLRRSVTLFFLSCSFLGLIISSRAFLQVVEKRPEVRFLEYADIPGILKDSRLLKFQKVVTAAKKHKSHHFATCPKAGPSHNLFEGGVLSNQTLEELYNVSPSGDPSPETLTAQVADLEQEVRNLEFRLQFLLNQRNDACQWLASAREQLLRVNLSRSKK